MEIFLVTHYLAAMNYFMIVKFANTRGSRGFFVTDMTGGSTLQHLTDHVV